MTDVSEAPKTVRKRILFFDILRILAVGLLLMHHTAPDGSPFAAFTPVYNFVYDNGKLLTYYVTSGPLGVYLLVFISGAVLYLSYSKTREKYGKYIWARVRRLYPAYWATLLLFFVIAPAYLLQDKYFLAQITGFLPGASYFQWWIGLFMSLYLIFPLLYKAVNRAPVITLVAMAGVTVISRIILSSPAFFPFLGFPLGAELLDRIVFTNFLFEFTLGMLVMKYGWFPKKEYANKTLFFAADVSYYVFLVHQPIRLYLARHTSNSFWEPSSLIPYLCTVLVVATALMYFDAYVQRQISRTEKGFKRAWGSRKG